MNNLIKIVEALTTDDLQVSANKYVRLKSTEWKIKETHYGVAPSSEGLKYTLVLVLEPNTTKVEEKTL